MMNLTLGNEEDDSDSEGMIEERKSEMEEESKQADDDDNSDDMEDMDANNEQWPISPSGNDRIQPFEPLPSPNQDSQPNLNAFRGEAEEDQI